MKILITGTAGFIGFHLSIGLSHLNHEIIGIDSISDYYDLDLKYSRLREAGFNRDSIGYFNKVKSCKYPNLFFIRQDITDLQCLMDVFHNEKIDILIHLAAQPGVRYSMDNPHSYVQSNLVGFVNVLECARHNKIKHLIYASSSSVYGMNEKIPFSEIDRVDYPISLYAATKKSNELLAHTYSHLYQLPTTALRFFTVYGPWGRPDMAPMLFASAITKNKPLKVFNKGNMERDFTYIDDVVEGIIRLMDEIPSKNDIPPYYRIFNIGNSSPIKLMDFISCLEANFDKKAIKDYLPMQPGDVIKTYADVSKLENMINYKPHTTLDKGVREFVKWYKYFFHNDLSK